MAISGCTNIAVIFDCICCDDQNTSKSAELAKEIAGVEETDNVVCYNVDNKYYSAVISLCFDDTSAEKANAILIITDIQLESSFLEAKKKWTKLESSCSAEILLLVCHCEPSSSIDPTELPLYQVAMQWCVEHGFEQVWWKQGTQVKGNSKHGGLLDEQTGIDRIREALQAHTWPSMTMKHDKTQMDTKNKAINAKDKSTDLQSREIIDKMLGTPPNEDEDNDKFEELFDKFMAMKETAQSLPHEQRKAYAEKVVMEFWQAIGGDEEEMKSGDENSD